MKDFKFSFNINEINLIIKGLGNMPYNQVSELISKIHSQAQEQMQMTSATNNGQETVNLSETRAN